MNTDAKSFPWENLNKKDDGSELTDIEEIKTPSLWTRIRPKLMGPAIAICLVVVGRLYSSSRADAPEAQATTVALLSPLPLAKGLGLDEIPFVLVNLNVTTIAKADRAKIVRPDQIEGRKNRLKLKKLVAPNQPLLWSMLEFRTEIKTHQAQESTQVIYGDTP